MTGTENTRRGSASGGVGALAILAAIVCAGLLAFAIVTKAMSLHSKGRLFGDFRFEHWVILGELAVIAAVLIFRRRWLVWTGVAVMFAGFGGVTFYHVLRGGSCGCFGALTPPPEVMVGIDLVMVLIAATAAVALKAPRMVLGGAMVAGLVALMGGAFYSYKYSPDSLKSVAGATDTREDRGEAPDLLLASDLGAEMRETAAGGPAYLVFIHEVGCHVCEQYLDSMEMWQAELDEKGDGTLRVRVWSKEEAFERAEIDEWAWEGPPHSFLVIEGRIGVFPDGTRMQWMGEDTPFSLVEDLKAMLEADSMFPMNAD
ncbi:MAG: hypothetical protein R3B46_05950 [Phycisphaerales bacterium]